MSKRNTKGFIIAICCVIIFPVVFAYIFLERLERPTLSIRTCLPYYGPKKPFVRTYKDKKIEDTLYHSIPAFSLISHLGDTVTQAHLDGKVTIVDFFFTTCKSICVPMTDNMLVLQEHFYKDKAHIQLMSFTVDPETDSVAQLFRYAQDKGVNSLQWLLITGNKVSLYQLARLGFFISAEQTGDGGPDDFIHDNHFVLIDRERHIRGYYDGTSTAATEQLIKDAEKLLVSYTIPLKEEFQ